MARRNISLPDALDGRLDVHRDRINVSKICAAALEKELDRIEGQAHMLDVDQTKLERLVGRLQQEQGEHDSWYRRGREAGETWAQDVATLHDFAEFEDNWDHLDGADRSDFEAEELSEWYLALPASCQTSELKRLAHPMRGAYVLGWYEAVRALWQAAKPRL